MSSLFPKPIDLQSWPQLTPLRYGIAHCDSLGTLLNNPELTDSCQMAGSIPQASPLPTSCLILLHNGHMKSAWLAVPDMDPIELHGATDFVTIANEKFKKLVFFWRAGNVQCRVRLSIPISKFTKLV